MVGAVAWQGPGEGFKFQVLGYKLQAMFDTEQFIAELIAQGGPALASAVEREFRTGWELTRNMAEQRERARSQTPHARSGGVDGLGRVDMSICPESYFYWLNKGRTELGCDNVWAEEEFRKDYKKDNTQAVVPYQSQNAKVSLHVPDQGKLVMGSKYGMKWSKWETAQKPQSMTHMGRRDVADMRTILKQEGVAA